MTIYIAPGWVILLNVFLIIPLIFVIIFKILTSTYLYEKTGHKLYYVKENGSHELIDSVLIFFFLISMCCEILINFYLICLFNGDFHLFYIGLVPCLIGTYTTIFIYLRIKVFYYEGDEAESYNKRPYTYPNFSMRWSFVITCFTCVIIGMYFILRRQRIIYCIIILFIVLHIFLLPDYMNRIAPEDVRTVIGVNNWIMVMMNIFFGIIFFITLVP